VRQLDLRMLTGQPLRQLVDDLLFSQLDHPIRLRLAPLTVNWTVNPVFRRAGACPIRIRFRP
jgi:hypothetical protein